MENHNPPPGRPDEIVSSGSSSPVGRDDGPGRSRPWSVSFTVWSVLAVVAVLIGGVAVVQWTNRPDPTAAQDAPLTGFQIAIPEPSASAVGTAVAAESSPTASASPTRRPRKKNDEGTRDADGPVTPEGGPDAAVPPSTTTTGRRDSPAATTDTDEDGGVPTTTKPADGPEVADPSVNLAASAVVDATSQVAGEPPSNVTDGNPDSYWESQIGFPQNLTVDLGRVTTVGRLTLSIPEVINWRGRTQVITVLGSPDGSNFSQIRAWEGYRFAENTGPSEVSFNVTPAPIRYLRLTFTDNSGQLYAQLGQLAAYSS